MIYLLITLWIWWSELLPVSPISQNNQMRQDAQAAYQAGQYAKALPLYVQLSRRTTTIDPAVRLNLGHTYFQLKQYTRAKPQYETLLQSDRPDLRTVAATQLGVMACLQGDSTTALALFEQALLEDANNEPARYNFEVIKKYYSGKSQEKKQKQDSTEHKPETENKPRPAGGQQVERSDRQDDLLRRFQRLNLSEEQALLLLNAMQEDDLPYALALSARQAGKSKARGNRW
ncbi:tetratricopeptide repeat protein [Spirosoma fluviale]|uniref:Tetratricopeptide repeat-containing protein n=1 Tax=Spirosoma fluviale TaxID=1597977 RepID=A0A286GTE3_9BACT|nr:tetratricopeptide repeat protein [Spirosoma fluviale]SOD98349.1 Tetratricopeptide repeat-containing protein [Spirosoma fluviale]